MFAAVRLVLDGIHVINHSVHNLIVYAIRKNVFSRLETTRIANNVRMIDREDDRRAVHIYEYDAACVVIIHDGRAQTTVF